MKKFFESALNIEAKSEHPLAKAILDYAKEKKIEDCNNDIITPLLGLFGGMNFDKYQWNITKDVVLYYGNFITAIINFLIMALIVFIIVRTLNNAGKKFKKDTPAKTTKKCPYCKSEIAIDATRCPHCTSELTE